MFKPLQSLDEEQPHCIGYLRGLRYREELRATGRPICCHQCRTVLKDGVRLLALSRIDRGYRIADTLAREYGTDREQMRADCYFAAAVDTIALYAGSGARDLILQGHPLLTRKTVLRISRTAPTRQRFELERARNGLRPLDTKGVTDPVFDTVDFGEVKSRLRRTQGKLGACLRALEGLPEGVRPTREERAVIRERLAIIIQDTGLLLPWVREAPEGQPCPCDLRRRDSPRPSQEPSEPPDSCRGVIGLLNQAQTWPKKCVRDWGTLLQQVQPLAEEKAAIQQQGELVISRATLLRRSLAQR